MENRFENFCYLVMKIAKIISRIKNLEMEEYDLKGIDVMCIYYLNKSKSGLSNKELVNLTYEDKGAISRAMRELKDKDIVSYEANKYNGLIKLTAKGKEISNYITKKSDEALKAGGDTLNDDERKNLYDYLGRIEENLDEYYLRLKDNK